MPRFQNLRRKAGILYNPHHLYKQFRHSKGLYQLENRTLPRSSFPDTSQGPTQQACLSKDGSHRLVIVFSAHWLSRKKKMRFVLFPHFYGINIPNGQFQLTTMMTLNVELGKYSNNWFSTGQYKLSLTHHWKYHLWHTSKEYVLPINSSLIIGLYIYLYIYLHPSTIKVKNKIR